jgi:hypothetical protein
MKAFSKKNTFFLCLLVTAISLSCTNTHKEEAEKNTDARKSSHYIIYGNSSGTGENIGRGTITGTYDPSSRMMK